MHCKTSLAIVLGLSLLAGCAVGQKIDIRSGTASIAHRGSGAVTVGVHDQRAYVRDGDKSPTFVGLIRGGYYNPFDANTSSGESLSADLGHILAGSLNSAGYNAVEVLIPYTAKSGQARAQLTGIGSDRSVLLTVNQLKTDTYNGTTLYYNLMLEVADTNGQVVANASTEGQKDLGTSLLNPPSVAKGKTPGAVASLLAKLLDDPAIERALSPDEPS